MAPQVRRELVVVDDLAAVATDRFLALQPRTVALAGGATPNAFYRHLATCDYPWSETDVFFSDERCVPPDHVDSNFRMANEALLAKIPARVYRMRGEGCDPTAYEDELKQHFSGRPAFDLVLLGLGEDGHTASLFSGDAALDERDRWVARVERTDHARLTLTLPVLSAAKVALFLVAGATKREALGRLMAGADLPAARVQAQRVLILADKAAAP